MGTRKFLMFTIATHFDFGNGGFLKGVLCRSMFCVADSLRVFLSKFLVFVFGSLVGYIVGFRAGECYEKNHSLCDGSNNQSDIACCTEGSRVDEFGQKEKDFQVQDEEQVDKTGRERDNSVVMETELVSSTSKYQLSAEKHISGFIEAPKSLICSFLELHIDSSNSINSDNRLVHIFDRDKAEDSLNKDLKIQKKENSFNGTVEVSDREKTEDAVDKALKKQEKETSSIDNGEGLDQVKTESHVEKAPEKKEEETVTESEKRVFTEFRFLPKHDFSNEVPGLSKDCLLPIGSKFDTIDLKDNSSPSNGDSELDAYEFLTENNVSEGLGSEFLEAIHGEKVENTQGIFLDQEKFVMRDEAIDSDDECIELELESLGSSVFDEEIWSMEDLIHAEEKHEDEDLFQVEIEPAESHIISEESQLDNSAVSDDKIVYRGNFDETENNHGEENLAHEGLHPADSFANSEESYLEEKESISDDDEDDDEDEDDSDSELEHDDILEQLKLELRLARTGGLPTILEESESPTKRTEELKPLKLDHKFEHKDLMIEIHKFYRSYLDKMKKLDILNSQAMHAIGLLQMKKPAGHVIKSQKSAVPVIKSLLTQNIWPCKLRRSEVNPIYKLHEQLRKDFELVYVGQLCLSWEILHWQYTKALQLQELDPGEFRHYNQFANELQLFQVLLQRFVENEPFQGRPRVQSYVNNRCVHCNFLQVPVIKDDSLKDKKQRNGDGKNAITVPVIIKIIEESTRLFWEFLRADKDAYDAMFRGPELQDSIDSELLTDIRTDFRKKEKRLKEILRTGSCIVKKLQKHHENGPNRALFFTQVDLKLISRVLAMSKLTTDQLLWCHEKLSKINFSNRRRLVLEPSFLLFPC